jgi:hypothetical protein
LIRIKWLELGRWQVISPAAAVGEITLSQAVEHGPANATQRELLEGHATRRIETLHGAAQADVSVADQVARLDSWRKPAAQLAGHRADQIQV